MLHFKGSNMYFLKKNAPYEIFSFIEKFEKMHLFCTTLLQIT
jgi:hypothetical protein